MGHQTAASSVPVHVHGMSHQTAASSVPVHVHGMGHQTAASSVSLRAHEPGCFWKDMKYCLFSFSIDIKVVI